MNPLKLLFLDVDGVLNNHKMLSEYGYKFISHIKAKMVADIVSATGCQVVLSSSWRHYPTMRDIVVFELGRVGVHILCDTEDRLDRNVEIQEVLDKYGVSGNDYAVIDDLSLTIPNLFKTSFYEGLTPHITAKVIAHFLKEICSV